ncbi:DUF1054 family protein, partial [Bacillus inaquosorum]|nr:DUF1054 family protein [Bacillus inaquosorum]
ELLCGIQLQKEEVLNMNNQEFLQRIDDAFQQLAFLYRFTQKVSQA